MTRDAPLSEQSLVRLVHQGGEGSVALLVLPPEHREGLCQGGGLEIRHGPGGRCGAALRADAPPNPRPRGRRGAALGMRRALARPERDPQAETLGPSTKLTYLSARVYVCARMCTSRVVLCRAVRRVAVRGAVRRGAVPRGAMPCGQCRVRCDTCTCNVSHTAYHTDRLYRNLSHISYHAVRLTDTHHLTLRYIAYFALKSHRVAIVLVRASTGPAKDLGKRQRGV